uniref:Uncharacterized protein n=1 Tax=Astatotilapia calliptera TaxID=8154 RepID=A0AAX7VEH4_ASTCA
MAARWLRNQTGSVGSPEPSVDTRCWSDSLDSPARTEHGWTSPSDPPVEAYGWTGPSDPPTEADSWSGPSDPPTEADSWSGPSDPPQRQASERPLDPPAEADGWMGPSDPPAGTRTAEVVHQDQPVHRHDRNGHSGKNKGGGYASTPMTAGAKTQRL